jgi:hypothetical protein
VFNGYINTAALSKFRLREARKWPSRHANGRDARHYLVCPERKIYSNIFTWAIAYKTGRPATDMQESMQPRGIRFTRGYLFLSSSREIQWKSHEIVKSNPVTGAERGSDHC